MNRLALAVAMIAALAIVAPRPASAEPDQTIYR